MITYEEIYKRCADMSSYEGRRAFDANGQSLYEVVHLTAQDNVLVSELAKQSAHLIADKISFGLDDMEYTDEGVEFTLKPYATIHQRKSFEANVLSCICSYVMLNWLSDKLPERANAWKAIHDGQYEMLPKTIRKKKPVLVVDEDEPEVASEPIETPEVTINFSE